MVGATGGMMGGASSGGMGGAGMAGGAAGGGGGFDFGGMLKAAGGAQGSKSGSSFDDRLLKLMLQQIATAQGSEFLKSLMGGAPSGAPGMVGGAAPSGSGGFDFAKFLQAAPTYQ